MMGVAGGRKYGWRTVDIFDQEALVKEEEAVEWNTNFSVMR